MAVTRVLFQDRKGHNSFPLRRTKAIIGITSKAEQPVPLQKSIAWCLTWRFMRLATLPGSTR